LTRDLREGIASNARSRLVFQCGQDDAAYLAHEMAPLDATALMSLERFDAVARLSIAGRSSKPFTLKTLPPLEEADPARALESASSSAKRYARPVELIDAELGRAVGPTAESAAPEAARRRKDVPPRGVGARARGVPSTFPSGNEKTHGSRVKAPELDGD
jgi:hypothetical protein